MVLRLGTEDIHLGDLEGSPWMDGIHRNGQRNTEKTYPGCLGRMVNLFEMNIGVSSNRRLTNEPHLDGSLHSRRRSDVSSMCPSGDPVERKTISEFKKGSPICKSNRIPMKMLIDEEMSKEVDSRCNEPNLVAKLMGLDALPRVEPYSSGQLNHSKDHRSCSEIPISCWEQQNGLFTYVDPNACKDAYKTWQKSQRSPRREKHEETVDGKKMSLVRQKFAEAKRLAMDVELRQSQQFQDALEVLSCNKDLFLMCLQEPNSVFSEHLNGSRTVPPLPEARRITVLRPFKIADDNFPITGNKHGTQTRKGNFPCQNLEKIQPGRSHPMKYYEDTTQPTRIVVLKPSPGRSPDGKASVSPQCERVRELHGEVRFGNGADSENQESRKIALAIAEQMHASIGGLQGDGALISSVFSNAHPRDSELMSPESRHSWDYVNRLGSPCSSPSFGRVSYSPDSSVCQEAKKRLSERWATVVSDENYQEQRLVRRTSKSLGEMLALSELKMAAAPREEGNSSKERKNSDSLLVKEEVMDDMPGNLIRSNSVPASSPEFDTRSSSGVPVVDRGIPKPGKDDATTKSCKSSFRGTLSSLFFLRNRKPRIDRVCASESKDQCPSFPGELQNITEARSDNGSDQALPVMQGPSSEASFSTLIGKKGVLPPDSGFSVAKPPVSKNSGDNLDQPSPISVLDPPFGDDERMPRGFLYDVKHNEHGEEFPVDAIGSNLIDKSPSIRFIRRNISWGDTYADTASSYPAAECLIQGSDDEQDWVLFAKTLLSLSGLEGEASSNSLLERWHSPESPLDPSLRNMYNNVNDKETMHEAKRRQKRSTRKLVFDCVNAALIEFAGSWSNSNARTIPCIEERNRTPGSALSTSVDKVWAQLNLWFSNESRCASDDDDESDLVSEMVVRADVVGKEWMDHFRMEIDSVRKEIAGEMLEDLMHEAVAELARKAW